jgi:hypothetical protein
VRQQHLLCNVACGIDGRRKDIQTVLAVALTIQQRGRVEKFVQQKVNVACAQDFGQGAVLPCSVFMVKDPSESDMAQALCARLQPRAIRAPGLAVTGRQPSW